MYIWSTFQSFDRRHVDWVVIVSNSSTKSIGESCINKFYLFSDENIAPLCSISVGAWDSINRMRKYVGRTFESGLHSTFNRHCMPSEIHLIHYRFAHMYVCVVDKRTEYQTMFRHTNDVSDATHTHFIPAFTWWLLLRVCVSVVVMTHWFLPQQ